MNDDLKQISEVSIFVSKDFSMDDEDSLIPAHDFKTLEEFKLYLTEKLSDLLDNKYETLINILYKIDVNEEKLSALFAERNREFIPSALADLIIERSLQKVKFRQKYRNGEL
jgi:hypothetical protein